MKNVCDTCEKQRPNADGSWYCRKYGIPLHAPRIYCVSKEARREQVQEPGNRNTGRTV